MYDVNDLEQVQHAICRCRKSALAAPKGSATRLMWRENYLAWRRLAAKIRPLVTRTAQFEVCVGEDEPAQLSEAT